MFLTARVTQVLSDAGLKTQPSLLSALDSSEQMESESQKKEEDLKFGISAHRRKILGPKRLHVFGEILLSLEYNDMEVVDKMVQGARWLEKYQLLRCWMPNLNQPE